MANWVHLASFGIEIELITVKDLLESNGINCVVETPIQSEQYSIASTNRFYGKIVVNNRDYLAAKELVKSAGYENKLDESNVSTVERSADDFLADYLPSIKFGGGLLLILLIIFSLAVGVNNKTCIKCIQDNNYCISELNHKGNLIDFTPSEGIIASYECYNYLSFNKKDNVLSIGNEKTQVIYCSYSFDGKTIVMKNCTDMEDMFESSFKIKKKSGQLFLTNSNTVINAK